MKVYVNYDPHYEKVICVHDEPDTECEICKKVFEKKRDAYFLEYEFEVQSGNKLTKIE